MKILKYTLLFCFIIGYSYCGEPPTPTPEPTPSPSPSPTPSECTPYSEKEVYTGGNPKEGCNSILKGKFVVPDFLDCSLTLTGEMYKVIRGTCFTVTATGASDSDVCVYEEDSESCSTDYDMVTDTPIKVDDIYASDSENCEELSDQSPGEQPIQAEYRLDTVFNTCCFVSAIFNDAATAYHTADDGTKESSTRAIQTYGVEIYVEANPDSNATGGSFNPGKHQDYSYYTSTAGNGTYTCYAFARAPNLGVYPAWLSTSADAWANTPGIIKVILEDDNNGDIVIPFRAKVKLSQLIERELNIQTGKEPFPWTGGSDARAEHNCELSFQGATTTSNNFIESEDGSIQNKTLCLGSA